MAHTAKGTILQNLIETIIRKKACLTILGSGYVGLSTAALFANAGFTVTATDVQPTIIETVNGGNSPINEPGLQDLISRNVQAGRLKALLNCDVALDNEDAVIISVQTPIDKDRKPDVSFLMSAVEKLGNSLNKGMLVLVSSTLPPGTLQKKIKPILESISGLKADDEFYLVYAPERITPGKALKEFVENPRLVGGIGPNSTKIAAALFKAVCKNVIGTDATTAEVAKAAENTFRDVNIAFANELALICEQHGVDVTKVVKLANTHPRVNIHAPGPGVGGPCLTKDPYFLIHKTESENKSLIRTARETNDCMPNHIVNLTLRALKCAGKNIKDSRITVLGTAYKADVDDARFSPSKPLIQELIGLGAEVIVYDPHSKATFGAKTADSLHETISGADCFILMTDHFEFRNLGLREIKLLMNEKPAIVDGRRTIDSREAEKLGFSYYGVGFGKQKHSTCCQEDQNYRESSS